MAYVCRHAEPIHHCPKQHPCDCGDPWCMADHSLDGDTLRDAFAGEK
jgi:hypothetical protein